LGLNVSLEDVMRFFGWVFKAYYILHKRAM